MNNKLTALKAYKFRHSTTLWLSNDKHFPIKRKIPKVAVWYLVYEENKARYNIYCNNVQNKQKGSLKKFVNLIHEKFLKQRQKAFDKEGEMTGIKIELLHIMAIHE